MAVIIHDGIFGPDDVYEAAKSQILAAKMARLEALTTKVGPEGYIHGWIKVGAGEGDKLRGTAGKIGADTPHAKETAQHLHAAAKLADKGSLSDRDFGKMMNHVTEAANRQGASSRLAREIDGHGSRLEDYRQLHSSDERLRRVASERMAARAANRGELPANWRSGYGSLKALPAFFIRQLMTKA